MLTTDTASNIQGSEFVDVSATGDNRGTVHEAAVAEIVGLIRAKYEDEGTRNEAIGGRAFEHAQWQRGNFPGYTGSDFDTLMNRIRDDVRLYVTIQAKSIRVADWVRGYVLKTLVTAAIGEDSAKITMHEYLVLVAKALAFSKKDVEGELVAGWLDFVKSIAFDRSQGVRVSAESFRERYEAHEKGLAALAVSADPAAAAAKVASEAVKAKAKAVGKANEDITASVSDALVGGHISAEGVLGILENVAKHHSIPLPSAIGFDPARCTIADCDLLASTMFQAGKYAEMVHLRNKLDKMVSAVEKSRAHALSTSAALREIAPPSAKVAAEADLSTGNLSESQEIGVKPTRNPQSGSSSKSRTEIEAEIEAELLAEGHGPQSAAA